MEVRLKKLKEDFKNWEQEPAKTEEKLKEFAEKRKQELISTLQDDFPEYYNFIFAEKQVLELAEIAEEKPVKPSKLGKRYFGMTEEEIRVKAKELNIPVTNLSDTALQIITKQTNGSDKYKKTK